MTTPDSLETLIREMVAPIVSERGLDIYDVEVRPAESNGTVRVVIERLSPAAEGAEGVAAAAEADGEAGEVAQGSVDVGSGTGISIADIAEVSRELGYLLEVDDPIPFSYRLEVSSPGVERSLRTVAHFDASMGERVRVILRQPTADGRVVLEGILEASDILGEARVRDDRGVVRTFEVVHVKRANTRYEFVKAKPGKGKRGKKGSKKKAK